MTVSRHPLQVSAPPPFPMSHSVSKSGHSSSRSINFAAVNINSITATERLQELNHFVELNEIDILAVSEMKIDSTVHPTLYALHGFHRPIVNYRTRKGGGTALYVRNNIAFSHLPELESSDFESSWVKVQIQKTCIIVCSCYLPPNTNMEKQDAFLEYMTDSIAATQKYNPDIRILAGDVNGGNCWLPQGSAHHSPISSFERKLKSTTEALSLTQLIKNATRIQGQTENLRDIILIDNPQAVARSGVLPPFSKIDHLPVFSSLAILNPKTTNQSPISVWDYAMTDVHQFIDILSRTDWDEISTLATDDAVGALTSTLLEAAERCIPVKIVKPKSRKPWVSVELRREMRKRDRLFRAARRTNNDSDWTRWRLQRNLVTRLNRKLKTVKLNQKVDMLLQSKKDPHKYHAMLREIAGLKTNDGIPPLIKDNDILLDEKAKADAFNLYFCEQTNVEISELQRESLRTYIAHHPRTESIFTFAVFTPHEILKCINSMDASKACGPDNIPTRLLKMCALYIAEPLANIFNKSILEGTYPTLWKKAKVKPIYKGKGSQSDIANFRPISLLPCVSKVFEKLMFTRLYQHIVTNDLLNERQSGYRPGHNTQLQLVYLVDKLHKSLDDGEDLTIVYLDISRYFEKIWHEGLLAKCQQEFGIHGNVLNWLQSYLSDRSQIVQVDQQESECLNLNYGVPQGSVLGPLLAIMYLNGLGNITENEMLFFADDSSVFTNYKTGDIHGAEASLQRDLSKIHEYGSKWAITFNAKKTSLQTFTRRPAPLLPHLLFDNQEIPVKDSHKHLGLTLSTDLRFKSHINDTLLKFNRAMSPLYSIASHVSRQTLLSLYKVYVQPHLDYCAAVYDGHLTVFDRARLEKAQNRAARLITGTPRRTSTEGLLEELGWTTLANRRLTNKLILYQKLRYDDSVPSYIKDILPNARTDDTGRELRNKQKYSLTLPSARTSGYLMSFIPNTTKQWNEMPARLRTIPTKLQFRKHLLRTRAPKPPDPFLAMGSKKGNILHTRLRLKSSQLNAHRYAQGKAEAPTCNCGNLKEDTEHFLTLCPIYSTARASLFEKLSSIPNLHFPNLSRTQKLKVMVMGPDGEHAIKKMVATAVQVFLLESQNNQRVV